jgi:hypothetical protein
MIRIAFSLALIFVLAFAAFADTIRLKDGSIIKGRITGFTGGKFVVTIGDGPRQRTMMFDADQVESIEFDAQPIASRRTPSNDNIRVVPSASRDPEPEPEVVITDDIADVQEDTEPPISQPATVPQPRSGTARPVELSVRVLADNTSNGWTNSGWVVRKGQRIRIVGDGEVSLGSARVTGPAGLYEVEDSQKLMKAVPTGALIAVIGDDNNDFIYVGAEREFVAQRDGALFLGLNEGDLNDNTGAFNVKVEIRPDGSD